VQSIGATKGKRFSLQLLPGFYFCLEFGLPFTFLLNGLYGQEYYLAFVLMVLEERFINLFFRVLTKE
jgi:hypothetical protein